MKGTNVKKNRPDREAGVSVIVGTLMLILITVTAAAGLAIMVSELQKDEMERQSHVASVENEELIIHGIEPVYNGTTLESMTITILNMNTADSIVQLVGISEGTGDYYPKNFTSDGTLYNNTNARLKIPAAKQAKIELFAAANFATDPAIQIDDPLRVWVISSYYNIFEKTFRAPTAEFSLSIQTEDLGATERDIVMLDGSASADDGSIVNWTWTVEDGSATIPVGNWSDMTRITHPAVAPGKTSSFSPASSGPFRITLTVTDDSGMEDRAGYKVIPRNSRFFPATYLEAVPVGTQVVATVRDLEYNPVPDATVIFTKLQDVYQNLTLDKWSGKTDATGIIITNVTEGTGTIRVNSGKISPVDVPVRA